MFELTHHQRQRQEKYQFWTTTYHGGLFMLALGILGSSMQLMALGSLAMSLGYGLRDCFAPEQNSVGPMTVYALVLGTWCSLAHLIAPHTAGTQFEVLFYSWSVPEYLLEAQILSSINIGVPLVAYDLVTRLFKGAPFGRRELPPVGGNVPTKVALGVFVVLLMADWSANVTGRSFASLGTLRVFFTQGTNLVIFALVCDWLSPVRQLPGWMRPVLVFLIAAAVLHALMYSFMRGEIAFPILSVFLAMLVRKVFSKTVLVAGVFSVLVIALSYGVLAELRRSQTTGTERLARIVSIGPEGFSQSVMMLVARNCQFAQLSHVVKIVRDEGFYEGETLKYLGSAFIPRLIWPDKPLIAPGQWFAEKLGHGTRLDETRFSNAINMTIAGEFYLNFGWLGALAGLSLLGFTFAVIWRATTLLEQPRNVVGQLFAGSVLLQSFGSSFASAIPQLVFTYLAFFAFGWVLKAWLGSMTNQSVRARIPVPDPLRISQSRRTTS